MYELEYYFVSQVCVIYIHIHIIPICCKILMIKVLKH